MALRLFWLLRLRPALDKQSPVEWLGRVMKHCGFRGGAFAQYREELASHPEAVLVKSCDSLLDVPEGPERLGQLVIARAAAHARLGRIEPARRELARVRDRLLADSPPTWATTLGGVLDALAWERSDEAGRLFDDLAEELSGLQDLHVTQPAIFDRLELLQTLRGERLCLHGELLTVADCVAACWREPQRSRPILLDVLATWASQPPAALRRLDRTFARASYTVGQFVQLVATRLGPAAHPRQPIEDVIRAGLVGGGLVWSEYRYRTTRRQVLRVCLEQWMSVESVADVLFDECLSSRSRTPALGELAKFASALREDVPLKTVVHGIQACYAAMEGTGH